MFEDIDVPRRPDKSQHKNVSGTAKLSIIISDEEDEAWGHANEAVAERLRLFRGGRERAFQWTEKVAEKRRRAPAPVVMSSSPDVQASNFVSETSRSQGAPASSPSAVVLTQKPATTKSSTGRDRATRNFESVQEQRLSTKTGAFQGTTKRVQAAGNGSTGLSPTLPVKKRRRIKLARADILASP